MIVESLVQEIAGRFKCVTHEFSNNGPNWIAPTGDPYIALCSGGVKEEGKTFPCLCQTSDDAIRLWRLVFREYAEGKTGVVYWREFPQVDAVDFSFYYDKLTEKEKRTWADLPAWSVYARLVISDKPIK